MTESDRPDPFSPSTKDRLGGDEGELRLIVFSSIFPSAVAPNAGLFVRERMFRVARDVPMVVVAPVAWSPVDWIVRFFRPGFRPSPVRHETMNGIEVLRPRFLSIPGVLKGLDGWLMAWSCYPALRRLQRAFKPTLIDGHFLYPDGFAATWLGERLGIPATVNIRGSKDQRLVGSACERPMRHALERAAGILSVSDQLVRDVAVPLGIAADKVVVIGNGIDLGCFQPVGRLTARTHLGIDADARVLVGVGNLIELKGFQRVIPLLPRLRKRFPNLQYMIIGGSAQQAELQPRLAKLAEAHGVSDVVRFCGPQPQSKLSWYYSAADLFVLATSYEGWANVFLEALACGLPIVTTRVGGNAQVVATPEIGTLVDYWAPDAFADAIADGLEREWDRTHLREYARTHAWDVKIPALRAFLDRSAKGLRRR